MKKKEKSKGKKTKIGKDLLRAFPESKINRRKEWRFDLPLQAIVKGKLPHGEDFAEETTLQNISSGGAYFCLDSGVIVGSKLNLIIDLPKELTQDKKIKLKLGGITVRLEEPNTKKKRQGVAVRFTKDFKFIAEEKESKK